MKTQFSKITPAAMGFVLVISMIIMAGWFMGIKPVLSVIPGSATMKFNTALLFFLTGISVLFSQKDEKGYRIGFLVILSIIIFGGIGTFLQYPTGYSLGIDNLFIFDPYSASLPGRMSPGTALCFALLAIGLYGVSQPAESAKKAGHYLILTVIAISFVAVATYLLQIPLRDKILFLQTMAIHTSVLFLLISVLLLARTPSVGFSKVLFGTLSGSSLLRKLIPFIIIVSFLMTYFLLLLLRSDVIKADFGIVTYTVVFILLSIIYVTILSSGLNKNEVKMRELDADLKQKNQELTQFKNALDQVAIVAITDQKGVIKYVNDNFCNVSKYSREELIGNTHAVINSGHHDEAFFNDLWKTISNGNIWFGEVKNRAKDGSFYWVLTAIIPFKNKSGKITEYMAIRQDITERKEAQELQILQYVKQLEQKNRELMQFAYIASHDLQEPLNTITNFSDILYEDYHDNLDDTARKSFQFIKQATNRMNELIKGLLEYSRLGREEKVDTINTAQLVEEICEDLGATISESGATVEKENLPELKAYKTSFRLLLQNFLVNAIKFRKEGVPPYVKISAEKNNGMWKFSIADNGIGIAPEHHQKIFHIFQRLHSKRKYEGTGIGLAHCRKIVQMHGGDIWVESAKGQGSTFHFTITDNLI